VRESLSPTAPKRVLLEDHAERIKRLEEEIIELRNAEPCRYGSEEAQALLDRVENKIYEDMETVKCQLDDSVEQFENRVWIKTDELVLEKEDEKQELVAIREEIEAGKQELKAIKEQIQAGKQELAAMRNEVLPQITRLNDMVQQIATVLGTNKKLETVPKVAIE
jgi:chromosome segregation ATPase